MDKVNKTNQVNKKAPWKDYAGNLLFEGDIIRHPDGIEGLVAFHGEYNDPVDQWRVYYKDSDDFGRLCLQVAERGQAAKVGGTAKKVGRPRQKPELLKIPVCYKLPRWLVTWLRNQPISAAKTIENAIVKEHNLIKPKGEAK